MATVPMATKLGNLVAYHEELPVIKLRDPLVTWFFELM